MRLAASARSPSGSAPGSPRTCEQGRTSFVRVFASLPGRKDRTAASAAAYSYLLVATDARSASRDRLRAMPCQKEENERSEVKSTKTIRMSLSREQPPARVERAQQEQDYAASRSGHAGCRLFLFRCKRECGLFSPRFAANDSPVEDCDQYFLRKKGTKKSCGRRPRLSSFRCKR